MSPDVIEFIDAQLARLDALIRKSPEGDEFDAGYNEALRDVETHLQRERKSMAEGASE